MAILLSIFLIFGSNCVAAFHLSVQQNTVGNAWPHGPKLMKTPRSTIRLPFDFVLFQHLPKTGGTTMRTALRILAKSRGQTLQICYNDMTCTAPVQKVLEKKEGVLTFKPDSTNQIVTGHGLKRGFDDKWKISKVAWVAVLRDPLYLLLSLWNHEAHQKESGHFNMSLDKWIEIGRSEFSADFYVSYFLKLQDPELMRNRGANSGIQISQNNSVWQKKLVRAVQAPNVVLMEYDNWQVSVNRLAPILNLTKVEADTFVKVLELEKLNRAPQNYTEIIYLKRKNYERVLNSVGLLSYLYSTLFGQYSRNNINILTKGQEEVVMGITFDNDGVVDLPKLIPTFNN